VQPSGRIYKEQEISETPAHALPHDASDDPSVAADLAVTLIMGTKDQAPRIRQRRLARSSPS
jgi:hypothetical protein